mmetsp:Transcript_14130/g.19613  ORF Transcript_14130/g.19613 Transcript_14130/m.19613 type:complete len:95 (+) Transcript_14130:2164-2448(+)
MYIDTWDNLGKIIALQMKAGGISKTPGEQMMVQLEHAKSQYSVEKLSLFVVVPHHKFHECEGLKFKFSTKNGEKMRQSLEQGICQYVMMVRPCV